MAARKCSPFLPFSSSRFTRSPVTRNTRRRRTVPALNPWCKPTISLRTANTAAATAAGTSKTQNEYLVIVPDHPGRLETRRQTAREHADAALPLINDDTISYFGATLTRHPDTQTDTDKDGPAKTPDLDINGSLVVVKASDERQVRELLAADAYTRRGVWDVARARIIPFKSG